MDVHGQFGQMSTKVCDFLRCRQSSRLVAPTQTLSVQSTPNILPAAYLDKRRHCPLNVQLQRWVQGLQEHTLDGRVSNLHNLDPKREIL